LVSHTVLYLPNFSTLIRAGGFAMRITLLAVAMALLGSVLPLSAQAVIQHYQLNIPRQPLDTALKDFAHQTGLQVARMSDAVDGRAVVGPINGELSAEEALKSLLGPRGLSYKMVNERTVAIVKSGDDATASIAGSGSPLQGTEEGSGVRDSKDQNTKEGTQSKSFWDRFRLAQVDQGKNSSPSSVTEQIPSSQDNSKTPSVGLEEIVVTATRREQSIEKVPISIAAFGQERMADLGITNIADLAAMTPGLQYDVPNGFASTITTLAIRGMNTEVGSNVVGVYLDDTPFQYRIPGYGNVGTPVPLTFDMQRVEVARGPQGTLFGAGSEGGTVRFIPVEPSLTNFTGLTQVDLGFTQGGAPSYQIGAAAGGPIVDNKIGFRASFWDEKDGGYIDRVNPLTGDIVDRNANTVDKRSGRIALAVQASDDITVEPAIYYQQLQGDDSGRFFGNYGSNPSAGIFHNGTFTPEVSNDELVVPTIKLQATLPFADLTFDSSYTHRTVRLTGDVSVFMGGFLGGFGSPLGPSIPVSPSDFSPVLVIGKQEAITEEIRLASNQSGEFVSWVTGIFFDHRKQQEVNTFNTAAFGTPAYDSYYVDGRMTDDQYAVFAQADFHLTHKLTFTLGERVARVISKETDYSGSGLFNTGVPPVGYSSTNANPNTPRAALTYQMDSSHMVYAAVAKGFRVGGGNAPTADFCGFPAPAYKPDYDWSYEIGSKDGFLDNRVQIDSSVFHVKWYKIQQIVIPACGSAFAENTADAAFNGFDLQAQVLVTDRLRADFSVGYVNAYFTNNYYISPGVPLVLSGYRVGQLPQVDPPWNVNLGMDYNIPLDSGSKVRLHGDYQFKSRNPGPFVTQIPNSPDYYNLIVADPPTSLFKARVEYERNALKLTAYVDNIFNSHPLLGAFQYPEASNILTYNTFRPRTLGLDAAYKF
jgi:iron complex outermembrane receptor protein